MRGGQPREHKHKTVELNVHVQYGHRATQEDSGMRNRLRGLFVCSWFVVHLFILKRRMGLESSCYSNKLLQKGIV